MSAPRVQVPQPVNHFRRLMERLHAQLRKECLMFRSRERLGKTISFHVSCWDVLQRNGIVFNLLLNEVSSNLDVFGTSMMSGVLRKV